MKKILSIVTLFLLAITLSACADFSFEFPGEIYAPSITEDEADFIGMVRELKASSVAILNTSVTPNRYGSGVIVENPDEADDSTYYIITTQFNVENATNVTVYLAPNDSMNGIVIGAQEVYELDEDIVLVKIVSIKKLTPIELIPIEELESINLKSIFSIGTAINLAYFNFLTNPAQVMGIQDDIIIHGTNLNPGQLGSPLYLKEDGRLIGINIAISSVINERPEVMINKAISINQVITIVEGLWASL
jgi:S1-C subfamily serine protease